MKLAEHGLSKFVPDEEDRLEKQEQIKDTSNMNSQDTRGQAKVQAVIYSLCKLLLKGKRDEKLSKGKLFKVLRKMARAEADTIRSERLTGSRGSSGFYANALSTLRYMEDAGKYGLKDVLEALQATSNDNQLYKAL